MRNRFAVFIKVFFIDLQSLTQRFGLRLFEESLLANRVIERAVGSDFQLFICGGNVHCGKQRVIGRFPAKEMALSALRSRLNAFSAKIE